MSDEDLKILKKDFPKIIEIFNFLRSNPHIAGPLGADQKKLIELRKKAYISNNEHGSSSHFS
jgi:hypothetical protein